jgi:hypothetical protein
MEYGKLIGKLAWWALSLQENDFQVVHYAKIVNWNANGLSQKLTWWY